MHTINVLVFGDLPGGFAPHEHGELTILFHRLDPRAPTGQFDDRVWAFVDCNLSELSGLEVCRRLRCNPQTANAHIVAVLEEAPAKLRRLAAQAGASEYTQRPINRESVIESIMERRLEEMEPLPLKFGDLNIDLARCQVLWDNKPVQLMPAQFRLLQFLVQHPGRIFTRQQLIEALGNIETRIGPRTVDVWIRRIRHELKKVGAGEILRTVHSFGYMLMVPK